MTVADGGGRVAVSGPSMHEGQAVRKTTDQMMNHRLCSTVTMSWRNMV